MNSPPQSTNEQASIEERRLQLDARRFALEDSFARKWLPTLATAVIGLTAVIFGYVQNRAATETTERARIDANAATERSRIESKAKDEREWGFKVIEMYFSKRELFDLTKNLDQATANLKVLAAVAPSAVQGLLIAEQSRLPVPGDDGGGSERLKGLAAVAEIQAAIPAPKSEQQGTLPKPQPQSSDFLVYIQYPEGRRDQALAAQVALQKLGYKAPGIELVRKVPSRLQIRYYRPEQKEAAAALVLQLGSTLQLTATADNAVLVTSQKQLPSGILELWLPSSP